MISSYSCFYQNFSWWRKKKPIKVFREKKEVFENSQQTTAAKKTEKKEKGTDISTVFFCLLSILHGYQIHDCTCIITGSRVFQIHRLIVVRFLKYLWFNLIDMYMCENYLTI